LAPWQVGVEKMHKDSKYVLFLDDDVRIHPGSIGALTREMEKNPEVLLKFCFFLYFQVFKENSYSSTYLNYFCCFNCFDASQIFIQTGYPLDLPSGSLGSYCIYEYHMVHNYLYLFILQSLQHTICVWDGFLFISQLFWNKVYEWSLANWIWIKSQ
jgi:hypothetical protein